MVTLTHNAATNAYDFETEEMAGSIQPEGAYHGVTRLIDRRTGRQVIHPKYSALNLFRLFAAHQGMGQPRLMARTTGVFPNAVEVRWKATEAHQGELIARYEVVEPNGVDLTVTLRCAGTYAGYELFVSNYFDPALVPHVYLKPNRFSHSTGEADLVVPMVNDVFRGTVLVFPRDAHAARRCVDGRWDRSEWDSPTVQMCPVRHHAHPVAFVADPEGRLGAALMSRPRDCYAISTRYHAEDEGDRMVAYSAFDFSLFGEDLTPGDERTVRVRLALTPLDEGMAQPLAMYREFCET
jgi:hypothetical protein